MKQSIVTIDGPAGVGKSTVSRIIAAELGFTYLDTGAMYRAVAYCLYSRGIDKDQLENIEGELSHIDIALTPPEKGGEGVQVHLNGKDISQEIRLPEISMAASDFSALPSVRQFLTALQRKIGQGGNLVAEGRDMGTVVFPGALFKFYLEADIVQRCRRRVAQLKKQGQTVDEHELLEQMKRRDENDSSRALAPLRKAEDALVVDTGTMDARQVCQHILHTIGEIRAKTS